MFDSFSWPSRRLALIFYFRSPDEAPELVAVLGRTALWAPEKRSALGGGFSSEGIRAAQGHKSYRTC